MLQTVLMEEVEAMNVIQCFFLLMVSRCMSNDIRQISCYFLTYMYILSLKRPNVGGACPRKVRGARVEKAMVWTRQITMLTVWDGFGKP